MHTPLADAVKKYTDKDTLRFHMPGHKGKTGFEGDVTEVPGTDNLLSPEGPLKEAQELAAKAFGAKRTFFMTGGSTEGNLAMLTAVLADGDRVIIDRASHISVFSALTVTGASPFYVYPDYKDNIAMPPTPEKIREALLKEPDAKAVFITSPNCFGFVADVKEIASICHSFNVPLLVDEAHGAHFAFSPLLPMSAMEAGADMCVQSAHKTLPALTGSAMLHLSNLRYSEKIWQSIKLYQSTSPSYLLLASIDYARAFMEEKGEELIKKCILNIEKYKTNNTLQTHDKTRVVIKSGNFESERVVPESTSPHNTVFICTVCDNEQDIKTMFCEAGKMPESNFGFLYPPELEAELTPKRAFLLDSATISLDNSIGRISKNTVFCYPPAVPIIAPGEVISEEAVLYLKALRAMGAQVHGIEDNDYIHIVYGGM